MAIIDKLARRVVSAVEAIKGANSEEPSPSELLSIVADSMPTDVGRIEIVMSQGRMEIVAMQQGRESWKSAASRAQKAKQMAGGVLAAVLPQRKLRHIKKQNGKKIWGIYVDRQLEGAAGGLRWETEEERQRRIVGGDKSYRRMVN